MKILNCIVDTKVSTKLTLSTLMFAFPIVVLLSFLAKTHNEVIDFAKKEGSGDAYQRVLVNLLKGACEYRTAIDASANKHDFLKDEIANIGAPRTQIDDIFHKDLKEVQDKYGLALEVTEQGLSSRKYPQLLPEKFLQQWESIKTAPTNASQMCTNFIADIRTFITHVGNTSNLILDPELDSYYLCDATLTAFPQTQNRISDALLYLQTNLKEGDPLTTEQKVQLSLFATLLENDDVSRIDGDVQVAVQENPKYFGGSPSLAPAITKAVDRLKAAENTFIAKLRELATETNVKNLAECFASGQNAFNTTFSSFDPMIDEMDKLLQNRIHNRFGIRNQEVIWTLMALACTIFVVIIIALSITQPLNSMIELLKDIAQGEGDLTKRLVCGGKRSEPNQLAFWFNTFVEKIQAMYRSIVESATKLNQTSSELGSNATQMSETVKSMVSDAGTVANASSELSKSVTSMSAVAEEISSSARNVASAMEEMNASIQEVSKNCSKESEISSEADKQAQQTREVMNQLSGSAKEIGKIVNIISAIADQTDLLALNATIEAAGAGAAGKGFAVVANEVKDLARKSAEATQQITGQIEGIQSKIQTAVTSIAEITQIIGQVNQIAVAIAASVEEQSVTVNEISKNIIGVSDGTNALAKTIAVSATNAESVTKSIQSVDDEAQTVSLGTNETQKNVQQQTDAIHQLRGVVSQFKS